MNYNIQVNFRDGDIGNYVCCSFPSTEDSLLKLRIKTFPDSEPNPGSESTATQQDNGNIVLIIPMGAIKIISIT